MEKKREVEAFKNIFRNELRFEAEEFTLRCVKVYTF